MSAEQISLAIFFWFILTSRVNTFTGWKNIINGYKMWFTKKYWTNYNIIEATSWVAKATIIIPALIFGINIWQFYIISLITSITLIWASNKKLLPILVGFNTLWIWLSLMVIVQNIVDK